MKTATNPGHFSSLWGIVLAAGDGERVEPMLPSFRGDTLPKQFVNFAGAPSMLQRTFERAEKLISRAERRAVTDAYREIEPLNFSTGLLERLPKAASNSLLTIPLEGVLWNDLGAPQRSADVLTMPATPGQAESAAAKQPSANRREISRSTPKTKAIGSVFR
jgi:hypothetical protein